MVPESSDVLRTCRLDLSACIPCTTGKENFPSERSSANPLFEVYCDALVLVTILIHNNETHFFALQIHQIVSDLEKHANQVDKGYIVSEWPSVSLATRKAWRKSDVSIFVVEQAIMSLIPIRRSPPVSR